MKDTKNINIEVPHDIWKKLKILSVHKETTLQKVAVEVLEKSLNGKKLPVVEEV